MRVALLSDIHANLVALEAVLAEIAEADEVWDMGDTVGYGPDPAAVLAALAERGARLVAGNHDRAVATGAGIELFNPAARAAALLHREWLTGEERDRLAALPLTFVAEGGFTVCHGSPRDPLWEYILNALSARLNFDHFDTPWCFVGHSHIQGMFTLHKETDRVTLDQTKPDVTIELRPKVILNPGSVGQPRDRDPRAAYAIYDTEARTWTARRVEYNIAEVQERIRESGLPEKHAVRIAEGW